MIGIMTSTDGIMTKVSSEKYRLNITAPSTGYYVINFCFRCYDGGNYPEQVLITNNEYNLNVPMTGNTCTGEYAWVNFVHMTNLSAGSNNIYILNKTTSGTFWGRFSMFQQGD